MHPDKEALGAFAGPAVLNEQGSWFAKLLGFNASGAHERSITMPLATTIEP